MATTVEIPPYLEEQVRAGRAVLVLGAGASLGAVDPNGLPAPKTDQLRDLLADQFLGGKLKNRSLSQVAEYAASESNIVAVQEFIRQRFESLQPTAAHRLLPGFRWWGLATTNYDRLIESAYQMGANPVQHLVPVVENGDSIDHVLRDPENVILLKLHGCITRTGNPHCPLILTVDQYIDHRAGRSRLFEQLTDWGYEHIFIFIGHSLQDSDIRQILKDLTKNAAARARFFCVVPDADPIEKRALEQNRITVLNATFEEFMRALDLAIPSPFRRVIVSPSASGLPIAARFRAKVSVPSNNLSQFVTLDTEYLTAVSVKETVLPADFYKGFNPGFSATEQQLDVRRTLGDQCSVWVTHITGFGNDLLTGANIGRNYRDVKLTRYNAFAGNPFSSIKYSLFASMQRLIGAGNENWSIGVLVSSKSMMLKVSSFLEETSDGLSKISHEALLDPEGPALSAVLIAGLLQGGPSARDIARNLTGDLITHIRGRKGGDISQADLTISSALQQHLATGRVRGSARQNLVNDLQTIADKRVLMSLTGDPTADWLSVRKFLDDAAHEKVRTVAEDARFVRLLNRGTTLRDLLSQEWRASNSYGRARQIVSDALLQEHFSSSIRPWRGVNVMTIHKSKGKDFDEVIIFEGSHSGRLLRSNATTRDVEQAKLTLRVGVTRARKKTTILIPNRDGCRLL